MSKAIDYTIPFEFQHIFNMQVVELVDGRQMAKVITRKARIRMLWEDVASIAEHTEDHLFPDYQALDKTVITDKYKLQSVALANYDEVSSAWEGYKRWSRTECLIIKNN